jgi:hypothetical protein
MEKQDLYLSHRVESAQTAQLHDKFIADLQQQVDLLHLAFTMTLPLLSLWARGKRVPREHWLWGNTRFMECSMKEY